MKNARILIVAALVLCVVMRSDMNVFAGEIARTEPYVSYSVEIDDESLAGAIAISEENYIKNGRAITKTVYQQKDGTLITDTFDVSAVATLSKNGTDTATRTRSISGWGTITITAGFQWYTEGLFSYVKCTSMSASYSLASKVKVDTWEKSYTKNYVKIGKAKAQVEYYFYNSNAIFQHQSGTFKITCSDSGTISDNS